MLLPSLNNRHHVLIGAGGTGTAFGAAMALRRHWSNDIKLVIMDINPKHLVTSTLLADAFEQVPLISDPEFKKVFLDIIKRYEVDTYLPLIDMEIEIAAKFRDSNLLQSRFYLLAPTIEAARICHDKYLTAQWLKDHNLLTPRTVLADSDLSQFDSLFFLKPRRGFGSRGAKQASFADINVIPLEERVNWVVQPLCKAPEVTVDVYVNPNNGFYRTVCRERLETKSGVCTKAHVFVSDELESIALKIAEGLGFYGTFCFQVMRYKGEWNITDINARPGAGTAISVAVGLDFFAAAFAYHWGIDPQNALPKLSRDFFVTRQYAEYVMG